MSQPGAAASAAAASGPPFTCSLHAGDVLGGRYQIRARMGMGGFACLFLGEDLVTGAEVAIKAQVVRLAGVGRMMTDGGAVAEAGLPRC